MRVGVIGSGYWGRNIVRNLLRQKEIDSLVVCDRNPAALEAIAALFPTVETLADAHDFLADSNLAAVFVVTPPETHYELGCRALDAGKHLYIEKPFVTDSNHARELVTRAAERSLQLMSGHTFLYSPPVREVKRIIDRGDLGKIEFISFRRINLGIHQRAVNVVWDLLPHDLSMALYWLGDVKLSRARSFLKTSVGAHPDVGSVFMEFDNATMMEGLVSWLSPRKLRETIVVGNRRMLIYNDTEPEEKIKIYDKKVEELEPGDFGEFQLAYRVGDVISPRVDSSEPIGLMVADFITAIREKRPPLSDGAFGLRITEMIEQALRNSD
ncbi:MAG: Gfo/Idh/MocA family oxidoreductase [Acidobacteriota bacterium]|jgi:predicted dehydrogenase|nr:Gfo/Idh/MocA family oxidoreductase [Acidobacteriota bacterium]